MRRVRREMYIRMNAGNLTTENNTKAAENNFSISAASQTTYTKKELISDPRKDFLLNIFAVYHSK